MTQELYISNYAAFKCRTEMLLKQLIDQTVEAQSYNISHTVSNF